ncbi:MAG: hypothetical protein H0W15_13070 [Gemmatimonadales bacterium]|nr:hypothetical protein [Gemmatimonadales bacterium]
MIAAAMLTTIGTLLPAQRQYSLSASKVLISEEDDLAPFTFVDARPDGVLLVGLSYDAQVLMLGSDGKRLRTIGRKGAGPGEFRRPAFGGWLGDSIWVYDAELTRISFFTEDGRHLNDKRLPMLIGPPARVIATSSQQALVWTPFRAKPGAPAMYGLVRWSGDKTPVVPVIASPQHNCRKTLPNNKWISVPYCSAIIWGSSRLGTYAAVLDPTASNLTGTGKLQITVVTGDGDTLYSRPMATHQVPLPEATFDSVFDCLAGKLRVAVAAKDRPAAPKYHPAASWVLLDQSGAVWTGQRLSITTRWTRYDRAGNPQGFVVLPRLSRLVSVDGMTVYAIVVGTDDEESLVRYTVR